MKCLIVQYLGIAGVRNGRIDGGKLSNLPKTEKTPDMLRTMAESKHSKNQKTKMTCYEFNMQTFYFEATNLDSRSAKMLPVL